VGFRSLIQVVLGIFGFALFIEFWTALANNVAHVGGAAIGAPVLLLVLIADLALLVVISVSGRAGDGSTGGTRRPVVGANCRHCDWRAEAPTTAEALLLRQQHEHAAHDS
jgi:hypothetical protein